MSHVGFISRRLNDTPISHSQPQAFITVLSKNKNLSYQQLLVGIRDILRSKYSQKPQLAASHPIVGETV